MKALLTNWIVPYAGWAALILLAVGVFSGLFAANHAFPLTFLAGAAALATYHFWDQVKTFDFWALDEWARMRYVALDVREWHTPHHAAEMFCSQVVARTRNDAAAEMNIIMMELIRGQERATTSAIPGAATPADLRMFESNRTDRNAKYDAAQLRYNQCNAALARELLEHLMRGDLLAKGLPTLNDIAQSERVIPISRWRVMTLDIAKAQASGLGWHYTGVVIGKKPKVRKAPKPVTPPPAKQQNLGNQTTRGRPPQRLDQPHPPKRSA